ncbi:N-acetyl-gamma-glutamyl-phosphate reductase [Secundilactobacillus paracollinoides]|uniref:N-acetyl-gamma-glutamyl-phosphate reductase n=1 Tax=Secundilactobacillus paracollinoides TaxID=240427 RepID=A0A1B2IXY6_9LACO|nr:N-acetyl-gamma-glutamyl-phosphate reductase [Secundilactobacillus paracollinoides]ANZ66880.1 N-acetyl-gamma-glutamyl-phosphate reductase [Secundilactobacillus paracollinoides]KRL79555.1 N-acetyl-gamma-glutamyl-phosphate reductase [Secundilactobacillus paracollinoides DSM 15502 = JCM 11969]
MNVAIVGVTGYSGTVLYSLLANHPEIEKINLYGHTDEGENGTVRYLDELLPQFHGEHVAIQAFDPAQIMADNQAVFFATSSGVSSQLAVPFAEAGFPVIDLSGDYRLDAKQYEQWYHKPAATTSALKKAAYSLADFYDTDAKYIANPGCYATATLLGLAPLVQQDLIDPDSIIVDAKSGTSGAGKKLSQITHFTEANDNLQLYKLDTHQHIPEIVQQLQVWNDKVQAIEFNTTLIPVTVGIMATIYAKPNPGQDQASLVKAFETTYADHPFIHVMDGEVPALKDAVGSNNCDLGVKYNPKTNTVMVVSVIDNLMKGAAGQAVQNFNHMFHYNETTGLPKFPAFS